MDRPTVAGCMHIIEAILFVRGEAVDVAEIARALDVSQEEAEAAVKALMEACELERRGVCVVRVGEKVQMVTRGEYLPYIQRLVQPPKKQQLTQAMLETLSVVAYRQPVTRGEIEAVRGVKCDYSLAVLAKAGLIEEQGRKDVVGRPVLYGTTEAFLARFGLHSLSDLPSVELEEEEGRLRLEPPSV